MTGQKKNDWGAEFRALELYLYLNQLGRQDLFSVLLVGPASNGASFF